jgi:NADH-quinone oxidoreductase subunit M
MLSLLVFIPLLAIIAFVVIPSKHKWVIQVLSLISTGIQLAIAIYVFSAPSIAHSSQAHADFFTKIDWISLNLSTVEAKIYYSLGIDGISAPLILMSAIVLLVANIYSLHIQYRVKAYHILFQVLSTAIMGCFTAQDLFLFFLFFEFMLLPLFFLIGIWGGGRKEYAAIKFFVYTFIGSVLILIVMAALLFSYQDAQGNLSLEFDILSQLKMLKPGSILSLDSTLQFFNLEVRAWAFLLLLVAFAIKLPSFPFHSWLPDAHVEAPTPISIILAGILLKVGAYGIIRIAIPIFPDILPQFADTISIIGAFSILYGALNALASTDLKRIIAFSSVSHMGFVFMGIAASNLQGYHGALFQLVSHGFLSAALFLVVGILYQRTSYRELSGYSGLYHLMPNYTFLTLLVFVASIGVPGFSAFIAEFMVITGVLSSGLSYPIILSLITALGLIFGSVYFLRKYRMASVFKGSKPKRKVLFKPFVGLFYRFRLISQLNF